MGCASAGCRGAVWLRFADSLGRSILQDTLVCILVERGVKQVGVDARQMRRRIDRCTSHARRAEQRGHDAEVHFVIGIWFLDISVP